MSKTINDRELLSLIKDGVSQVDAAKKLGVSKQAVSKKLKSLRSRTTRVVVSKKVEEIVDTKMDAMAQLAKANKHCNDILDRVMAWLNGDVEEVLEMDLDTDLSLGPLPGNYKDPHDVAFKAMAEIRQQQELQLKIFQTIHSLQASKEFMDTVLEVIGEVNPNVRTEILNRLNQRRAIRGAVEFS